MPNWCRRARWPNGCAPPGAGIPAFYTPTAVGTEMAEGRETRVRRPRIPAGIGAAGRLRVPPRDARRRVRQPAISAFPAQLQPGDGDGGGVTIVEVDEDFVPAGASTPTRCTRREFRAAHGEGAAGARRAWPQRRRSVADERRSKGLKRQQMADRIAMNSRTAGSSTSASACRRCAPTPIRRPRHHLSLRERRDRLRPVAPPGEEDLPGQRRRAERHAEAGRRDRASRR